MYLKAQLNAILVPKAVLPIDGLPAIIIRSDLCKPPSFLSKSLKPVGRPAIFPSLLKASLIISTAFVKALLKKENFLSVLPVCDNKYKSFSVFSIISLPSIVLSLPVSLIIL